jgi:predicted phosphoadenosine phosphosulfate sulfurtransferase
MTDFDHFDHARWGVNVLEAARWRMQFVFNRFERVVVSASGGKDSTVLWHLAVAEAARLGRKVELFFLDQEAEYQGTIDQVEHMMAHPSVVPAWMQVPLRMTNATSHRQAWFTAWRAGDAWMRPRSLLGVEHLEGAPDRFYDFFPWYEAQKPRTAFLVGLRSRESLNRWRAVAKNPGLDGIAWSTHAAGDGNFRFYPLFDWATPDVWRYLAEEEVRYNAVYDRMYALRGANERTMRVSFLMHEQSFKGLATLQELEPDTYERLLRRIAGAHVAALYAEEVNGGVFGARSLPPAHASWREYRDYLLASTPSEHAARFAKRFARQADDDATCREHVRQLLCNDWENNVPVRRVAAGKLRAAWWDRL